jgi:hypothetical protein
MKILKRIVLAFVGLVVLFLLVGLILPSKYHVQRAVVVQAKPETIFPWINNLKKWPEWSAWTKEKDATLNYTYEGPEEGAGAISRWEGKKMGEGMMRIIESGTNTGAKYDLSFEHGRYRSIAVITFEPQGESTRVIWNNDGDLGGNPISRYFGLFMERMIGPDFEEGLAKLKVKAEGK